MAQARVLVVDDEEITFRQVRRALAGQGMIVDGASTAEEALGLLQENTYSIVITDLVMPGMDGLALVDLIRQRLPGLPTVMVSAWPALESVEIGASSYLAKPFSATQLTDAVWLALGLSPDTRTTVPDADDWQPPASRVGERFVLRDQSWLRFDSDGQLTFGIEPALANTIAELRYVRLLSERSVVSQFRPCAGLVSAHSGLHLVQAPITARVLQVNAELIARPARILEQPLESGWICRVEALNLRGEIDALVAVAPDDLPSS
jgi:CheY-like chemotaxis protein